MKKRYAYNRFAGEDITVQDSIRGIIEKLSWECNTFQFTQSIGKNKFDGVMETGNIDGTTGLNTALATRVRSKNYVSVAGNSTYTLSRDIVGIMDGTDYGRIYGYDENCTYIGLLTVATNWGATSSIVFTTPLNCRYIRFYDNKNVLTAIYQLELGSTKTTYEAYIPPMPSPNYPSTIYSSGDGGAINISNNENVTAIPTPPNYVGGSLPNGVKDTDTQSKLGKVVLNGSENWQTRTHGANVYGYQLTGVFDKNNCSGRCSHFNFIQGGASSTQNSECIASASTQTTLNIFTTVATTVTDFKAWLSTHNVIVYYELATPVDITITMPTIETYNGQNVITSTSPSTPNLTVELWATKV